MEGGKKENVIPVADSKDLAKKHYVKNHNNMDRATLIVLPNINSARVERAADNNDIHVDTSSGIQQEGRVIAASTKELPG
jgi:hypothetical protein